MSFKKLILQNKLLYTIAIIGMRILYIFSNSAIFHGRRNNLQKHHSVLFRKVKIRISGNDNNIIVGKSVRLKGVFFEIKGNNNKIIISDDVIFYEKGYFLIEGNNCCIRIGKESTFGSVDLFAGESNTKIEIGERCMFSRSISVTTSDFHSIIDISSGKRINKASDIKIGNHVWVGYSAYIYQGVSISDDSVIAAKAFVNKSFDSGNVIIAGIPAKVVKEGITWSREKL